MTYRMEKGQLVRHTATIIALGGGIGASTNMLARGRVDLVDLAVAAVGLAAGAVAYRRSLDDIDPINQIKNSQETNANESDTSYRI